MYELLSTYRWSTSMYYILVYILHYIPCRNYLQFSIWKSLKPFSKYSDGYCWVPKGKVLLANYIFTTHRHIMYILSYSRAIIYPVRQDVPRSSKHPISSVNNVLKKKNLFSQISILPKFSNTYVHWYIPGALPSCQPSKIFMKTCFCVCVILCLLLAVFSGFLFLAKSKQTKTYFTYDGF